MTCIVAYSEKGKVFMGGDSAGVASTYQLQIMGNPKVFKIGTAVIGGTSSFRMLNLLRYKFKLPVIPSECTLETYMNTYFVDSVKRLLKKNGYSKIVNNKEWGGEFLVGIQGRIFKIQDDFNVGWGLGNFDSCGSGEDVAKGSLFASAKLDLPPKNHLLIALEAAESFSAGVRRPFIFVETE